MTRFYLKKARWKCRHCGNTYDIKNEPGKPMKQPSFCECKHRDFELDLDASDLVEETEKIESPLFQQGKFNVFVDYIKLAEMFQEKQPFFYDKSKIWWLWNPKKFWERIDETDMINAMDATVNGLFLFKSQTKNEIMNALKMQGRKKMPKPMQKTWVHCGTKIYDLKGGKFFDASPKWFTTNPIPWDLTKSQETETPNIDKLFNDWVEPEYVPLLYEIPAYCMLSGYPIRRVFCLDGEGANGKTSYMHIIENLVGKENVCTTDFSTLVSRPFETSKLYKKLVCEMGEISHKQLNDTQTFKKLTGGDMIRFEFKGKDGFDDYSYAKLIIATNKLPESPDKSKGYFDRWCIIDFKNIFEEKPDLLDCIPPEEYENLGRKCLKILMQLLKNGKFTKEGQPEERRQRYEERASPINDFLKGYSQSESDAEIPLWEIHEDYCVFLAERGYRKASRQETAKLLRNRGCLIDRKHITKEDGTETTMRVVYGVGK